MMRGALEPRCASRDMDMEKVSSMAHRTLAYSTIHYTKRCMKPRKGRLARKLSQTGKLHWKALTNKLHRAKQQPMYATYQSLANVTTTAAQ